MLADLLEGLVGEVWYWRVQYNLLVECGSSPHSWIFSLNFFRCSFRSGRETYTCASPCRRAEFDPLAAVVHSIGLSSLWKCCPEILYRSFLAITPSSRPHPPVVGKVTHHSIELYWDLEKKAKRQGPQEQWCRFAIEEEDPKMHTYGIIYT